MYEQFYGLRERPFSLTSHLKYLLLTAKHQEVLSNLEYGIAENPGMTLVVGQAGTGKTTLLRKVRDLLTPRAPVTAIRWVVMNNPILTPGEFFETLAHELELGPACAASKSKLLRALETTLLQQRENGVITVLVIDEAQSLSDALFEELRLLTNIEHESEKLLRVVVAGQPALGERLNEPGLEQLKQRIALRCVLPALDLRETAGYIAHRISLAGGSPGRVFSREAIIAIHACSRGVPRTINVLCDNALLTGFAADEQPVGPDIVAEVSRDFAFATESGGATARLPVPPAPPRQNVAAVLGRTAPADRAVPAEASRRFSFAQFASRRR
jgi:general secretion pathway protein A